MRKYILLIALSSLFLSVSAQNITGRVVDENNMPLEFVNVVLLTLPDSTFLSGQITDIDGKFIIPHSDRSGVVKFSSIGYSTLVVPTKTDMGTIQMHTDAQMLGEVIVKANLPKTLIKGDALITGIENTVLAKLGAASDVLSKIPGLIEKDGSYEVLGKGVPQIYINGRLVRDKSELEMLNATEIKQVEVVNNPGSQYNASVKAVVRIRTIGRKGDGLGFDVMSGYEQGKLARLNEQLNLNYRHNNLDIFATLRYQNRKSTQYGTQETVALSDTLWDMICERDIRYADEVWDAVGGINYQFNENNAAGLRYQITLNTLDHTTMHTMSNVFANNKPYDLLEMDNIQNADISPTHLLNMYYSGRLGQVYIDWNTDYYYSKENIEGDINEISSEFENRTFTTTNIEKGSIFASKLIFNTDMNGNLLWGGEYVRTDRKSSYRTDADVIPSSDNKIKENSIKLFAEYSRTFDTHHLTAGLRYEHVKFNYFDHGLQVDEQSRAYSNFFPTLSWSTAFSGVQTQLSYAWKTQRPAYSQLSSDIMYENRFTLFSGSPSLQPTQIHDITFNSSWKFLQLSMSYQETRNAIIYWGKPMNEHSSVTMMTYVNINRLPLFTLNISAAPKIGLWSPQLSFYLQKQCLTMSGDNNKNTFNSPIGYIQWNNVLQFTDWLTWRIDGMYVSKGNTMGNSYINKSQYIVSTSLHGSFLNEALTIELKGSDLLKQNEDSFTTTCDQYFSSIANHYDRRAVSLTVRYRFNTGKSKYKGKSAGADEMNRL